MLELDTTRDRIVEAAGAVFAEKGFDAATVREICQLAQANVAAINYYFGDKQHLYLETVKRAHMARAAQAPLPQWAPGTPAETKLSDFIRTLLSRMLAGGATWHTQLMLREISRPSEACEELVHDYIRPQFELLQEILAELLPPEITPMQRHLTAFSIVGQCLHYRVADPVVRLLVPSEEYQSYDLETLAEHIIHFTMSALGMRSAASHAGGMP